MFRDKKIIALLLLVVIVAFSVLSEYNVSSMLMQKVKRRSETVKEGYSDPPPACQTNENVPGCSYDIKDDDSLYSYNATDNNYILKTEIVPPVCPACPTLLNNHGHETTYPQGKEALSEETNIISQTSTNEEITNTENITNTNVFNTTTNQGSTNQDSTNQDSTNSIIPNGDSSSYLEEIERLKEEIKQLKESKSNENDDSCPPCPPCERCPEPSFTCEKVLNYRSPNVGNYLPLPVLNDFSTFDNSK